MKIIEETHIIQPCTVKEYNKYLGDMNMVVIDIETTGLSAKNSAVILVGFLSPDSVNPNQVNSVQLFAENFKEEKDLLLELDKRLTALDLDGLVTFNGHRFDIPYLKARAEFHGIEMPSLNAYHLDLYRLVRKFSDLKSKLPNLKQKTLENYMGLWEFRQDLIDGGESLSLYFDYLDDPKDEYLDKMLLHNKDDILNLYRLSNISAKTDIHKGFNDLGFPVLTENGIHTIAKILVKDDTITISGKQSHKQDLNISTISFDEDQSPIAFNFNHYAGSVGEFSITAKNIMYMGERLQNTSHEILNQLSKELLLHCLNNSKS